MFVNSEFCAGFCKLFSSKTPTTAGFDPCPPSSNRQLPGGHLPKRIALLLLIALFRSAVVKQISIPEVEGNIETEADEEFAWHAKTSAMNALVKLHKTKLAVKLIRSTIGRPPNQRKIVQVLGLKKINGIRIHDDGPRVWGMLEKVIHLVKIERIRAEDADSLGPKKL